MRVILIIAGVCVAAVGGTIAYRSFFLEPAEAVVITDASVREVPNVARIAVGLVLLVGGAALAFVAALRRRR